MNKRGSVMTRMIVRELWARYRLTGQLPDGLDPKALVEAVYEQEYISDYERQYWYDIIDGSKVEQHRSVHPMTTTLNLITRDGHEL